jgi:hypothetical protein
MKCLKSKTIFEQNLMEGKKSKVLSIKDLRNQLPRARKPLTINNLQRLTKQKSLISSFYAKQNKNI